VRGVTHRHTPSQKRWGTLNHWKNPTGGDRGWADPLPAPFPVNHNGGMMYTIAMRVRVGAVTHRDIEASEGNQRLGEAVSGAGRA